MPNKQRKNKKKTKNKKKIYVDVKEKVTKGGKKERVERSAFVQCPSQ